jgi:hypothetical protein
MQTEFQDKFNVQCTEYSLFQFYMHIVIISL